MISVLLIKNWGFFLQVRIKGCVTMFFGYISISGACRKISSTREQNKLRVARKNFLFWGSPEKFWGWVYRGWNTMFWGWKWWWVTTQTVPKWISYYMLTLNILCLTLGRIRGLNISFKIHVATCSMQYTTSCHEVLNRGIGIIDLVEE